MLLVVVNYEWEIVQTIPAVTFKLDETRWPRRGKILQAFQLMEPAKSHYSGLNTFLTSALFTITQSITCRHAKEQTTVNLGGYIRGFVTTSKWKLWGFTLGRLNILFRDRRLRFSAMFNSNKITRRCEGKLWWRESNCYPTSKVTGGPKLLKFSTIFCTVVVNFDFIQFKNSMKIS